MYLQERSLLLVQEHAIATSLIQAPRTVNTALAVEVTIPVGNRIPKLRVIKNMWVHKMLSTGSNVIDWPGGNSSSWCSCEATKLMKRDKREKRYCGRKRVEPVEVIIEDIKGGHGEQGE